MKNFLFLLILGISFSNYAQTSEEYFDMAYEAMNTKDYKTVIKYMDKVLELETPNADYYNLKSQAYYELKQYNEAYETISTGIKRFPKEASLYDTRGNYLISFQEYDYAVADFDNAIALCTEDSVLHFYYNNRSAAKFNKRDFQGAYDDLMVAYSYDSTDVGTLTNLGAVCDEVGRGDETLKYLLKCVEADSTFYGVYVNIGFKYQEMGEYDKAIEYFDLVLEHNENDPLGYSNRSYCKLKLGDLKGAMKDINESIKIYPQNPYAYRNRALIYLEDNKENKACEDIQTALDRGFTQTYGDEVYNLKLEHCME